MPRSARSRLADTIGNVYRLLQYRSGEGSIRLEDDDEKSRLARPEKVEAESFNYRIRPPLPVSFPVPPLPPHRHPGPLFEKE